MSRAGQGTPWWLDATRPGAGVRTALSAVWLIAASCAPEREDAPTVDTAAARRLTFQDAAMSVAVDADDPLVCGGAGTVTVTLDGDPPRLDAILVLDSSGSISNKGWRDTRNSASSFVTDVLSVSATNDHVGVIEFDDAVVTAYTLAQPQDPTAISTVIQGLPHLGGSTHTKDAVQAAITQFDASGRTNTGKVLVLVTDGDPNPAVAQDPCPLAPQLQSRGIAVFVLGVGSGWTPSKTSCLVTDPSRQVAVRDYSELQAQMLALAESLPVATDVRLDGLLGGGFRFGAPVASQGTTSSTAGAFRWTVGSFDPHGATLSVPYTHDRAAAPLGGPLPLFSDVTLTYTLFGTTAPRSRVVGSSTTLANCTQLAGHVVVGDFAVLGGFTGIHQFCRVGAHAMTGVGSVVLADVPPYVMAMGNTAQPHGINSEGLKRRGFGAESIAAIRRAYKTLYKAGLGLEEARQALRDQVEQVPELAILVEFLETSKRSIIR